MASYKQQNFIRMAPVLLFVAFTACGHYDPALSAPGPLLRPSEQMTGQWTGFRTIRNRQGTLMDTAAASMECSFSQPVLTCEEHYSYSRSGIEKQRTVSYMLFFPVPEQLTIEAKSGRFTMTGSAGGQGWVLEGEAELPVSEEEVSIESRLVVTGSAPPVPAGSLITDELYTWWGLNMGSARTIWVRK